MRIVIAFVFGCALMFSATNTPIAEPATATELSCEAPAPTSDVASGYKCQYSPLCQRASQCVTYCAGGIPACVLGCCACAS
jgi:hypothetical protein